MMPEESSGVEAQEVESRILAFLERELLDPEATVQRDDDLLSGELLDSVAVLRLAAFVEEEFQIKIEPADFVIENFQSVAVLAGYVVRAAGPAADPPASGGA